MNKYYFLALSLFISISFISRADAIEPINYNKNISISLKYQINNFLNNEYDMSISAYDIAGIDLNNDGIDEHILKQKKCYQDKKVCKYLIIAEKRNEIILLSKIKAKNIMIGETSSNGVKDILVFKNQINDYDFDIYIWSSEQKMYIINSKKAKNQG